MDKISSSPSEGKEEKKKRRLSGQKKKKKKRSRSNNDTNEEGDKQQFKKPRRSKRPLNGLVVSISTTTNSDTAKTESTTYGSVSQCCKELGAEVLGQVGKRVQFLICTTSAVQQASQRVRKAFKKKIPIVSVDWLEKCRLEDRRVDFLDYRLDEEAEKAIQSRKERCDKEENSVTNDEIPPDDAGWSEAKSLGCCCVCHENGTEKDCPWCVNGCS